MVEGAGLENRYTPRGYRGFESRPLRHFEHKMRQRQPFLRPPLLLARAECVRNVSKNFNSSQKASGQVSEPLAPGGPEGHGYKYP